MALLEDLKPGAAVKGLLPTGLATIISVNPIGRDCLDITYRDAAGNVYPELVFRSKEPELEIVEAGRTWSYTADASVFRLASEANRIRLAYLFDPLLAVHTSLVRPLPHQISAVYEHMLPRQPLRFLLADDPGAGKTIMAGLLMKELLIRGDLSRCLVVCPGALAEQWQDELAEKFGLHFEILTNDRIEAARTGNPFTEIPLLIARLDKLSRNEELQEKLRHTDWDLIVCDEAHKLSASFFGGEVRETKRYRLGKLLSGITRHFLLMTATPHNGKEEDFQLFMALLDGDRFEGRFRDGVHVVDTGDMMRRLVKEQLLTFEGTPLFPERRAYTVTYHLSPGEAELYRRVTEYVREEFNRVERLENEGRKTTVGFALTSLQRRLASSPEAIYQSLRKRREKLERRLREAENEGRLEAFSLTEAQIEDLTDEDELRSHEGETLEEQVTEQASAARTVAELRAEIVILRDLEKLALQVRASGEDRKWEELSKLLQNQAEMFNAEGYRRKLVIFTEHRDTLNYLRDRIASLLGRQEAVVCIHGGMGREERKRAQEAFTQDRETQVLVATDAAGEGINLQRAHLMVNYDLPWNPNRLEQRFGRIHRIGQTEVCHLWNLVAEDTREGDVYLTLLRKLEVEREALGGGVFDVLGKAIDGKELRELLIEAIRYGDQPEVRARLTQKVEGNLDRQRLKQLLEERALAHDVMDIAKVRRIREEMERAEARRLQPHFISAFFLEAFRHLGGRVSEREKGRYELLHVPVIIRNRDRIIGMGAPILPRYERVCFEKDLINVPGRPHAEYVCPGHPLLDAVTDLILESYRDTLKQGTILVDEADLGEKPRALVSIEHAIRDGRTDANGNRRTVSRRMVYVYVDEDGETSSAGYAPYLDCRPPTDEELALVRSVTQQPWLATGLETQATEYAVRHLVPEHYREVRERVEERVARVKAAVTERLQKEIHYWDHRARELERQEAAGKVNARLNSQLARQRADDLTARLERRLAELEQERHLAPLPPVIVGGALVVPRGLLEKLRGRVETAEADRYARETRRVELAAMAAVMEAERSLGYEPRDVSAEKRGYDIESRIPETGKLRFIEVKGRISGADVVTVTKNEILTALNKPDDYILALVRVPGEETAGSGPEVRYIRTPFRQTPDFGVTSVNYAWSELWSRGEDPYARRVQAEVNRSCAAS